MEMKEPNFLIIGAGKSGTTALYSYLCQHPEVFMSPVKETNFFALEGEDVSEDPSDLQQMRHYPWSVTDWEAYKKLFAAAGQATAIGEASPMYLYSKKAADSIKRRLPNAKLIVILRQPVERLYSRYLHLARENRLPTADFSDALDENTIWWQRNDLVNEGRYASNLRYYLELFGADQIKVILYEDFKKNTGTVLQELFQFIGVNPEAPIDLDFETNVSGFVKNKSWDKIIGQQSTAKAVLKQMAPGLLSVLKNNHYAQKWLNKLRAKNLERPRLDSQLKQLMTERIYKSEILELQQLLHKDLTHWLA